VNPLLRPLSASFRLGVAFRRAAYHRGWFKTRRLSRPVVSIGNLTVGGTGKTPLIALITRSLLKQGWTPAILTRGYGRRRGPELLALPPAARRMANTLEVGDEPAWLARTLPEVPIVVCGDRFRAGRVAEQRFHVDLHLLDDGFQHLALARDVDLVVLDVTQDFSDLALLPAGRQREPCSALERAQMIVLSRVELADPSPFEKKVRCINPRAPVFHSATELCGVIDAKSGRVSPPQELNGRAVSAFCGIGNPGAFFADLRKWGFTVASQEAFPDHHVYTEGELRRVSRRARATGAVAMLTTEKDAANLPPVWEPELPVLACAIKLAVPEAEHFEATLLSYLRASKEAT
jgi:tetraacyldisaccharide 4'-kinase